jgi:hypothetical protein
MSYFAVPIDIADVLILECRHPVLLVVMDLAHFARLSLR